MDHPSSALPFIRRRIQSNERLLESARTVAPDIHIAAERLLFKPGGGLREEAELFLARYSAKLLHSPALLATAAMGMTAARSLLRDPEWRNRQTRSLGDQIDRLGGVYTRLEDRLPLDSDPIETVLHFSGEVLVTTAVLEPSERSRSPKDHPVFYLHALEVARYRVLHPDIPHGTFAEAVLSNRRRKPRLESTLAALQERYAHRKLMELQQPPA